MSYWVATCIITQPSIEKQALILSKFIRLALDLFKLHNYNGVAEITSALNNRYASSFPLTSPWLMCFTPVLYSGSDKLGCCCQIDTRRSSRSSSR